MPQPLEMHETHGPNDAADPVCGMTVDRDDAKNRGLHAQHEGTDYFFCGKGCKLDFLEDPAHYLAPDYHPHM